MSLSKALDDLGDRAEDLGHVAFGRNQRGRKCEPVTRIIMPRS
jgi:hypothetical protein